LYVLENWSDSFSLQHLLGQVRGEERDVKTLDRYCEFQVPQRHHERRTLFGLSALLPQKLVYVVNWSGRNLCLCSAVDELSRLGLPAVIFLWTD
jgi:hypothetical protein